MTKSTKLVCVRHLVKLSLNINALTELKFRMCRGDSTDYGNTIYVEESKFSMNIIRLLLTFIQSFQCKISFPLEFIFH